MPAAHVRLHRSPSLATGVPYAYAASTSTTGRVLFTAGACPLDADGATVAVGDVVGQASRSWPTCASSSRTRAPVSPTCS